MSDTTFLLFILGAGVGVGTGDSSGSGDGAGSTPDGGGNGSPEANATETVESLQAKLAKIQEHSRTWEKRAKENSAAAKRLAEIEESQKSEAEKAADRIAKAEAEAASVPVKVAEALKAHLVPLHGIDAERAELFLTATEPELLLKQVAALVGESDKRQKRNHVPLEGNNSTASTGGDDMREFTRQLFGGANDD